MKKINVAIFFVVISVVGVIFYFLKKNKNKYSEQQMYIGVLQTASHPALDATRDGFIEELTKLMGKDVSFVVRNGQGSVANIHTIAKQFHNDQNISTIFAIATPATQAIATIENSKPIFFATVTDIKALELSPFMTNICGCQDMIDVPETVKMLVALLPKAQTVGLIYNNGELNSVALVKMMHSELRKHGLNVLDFAVIAETELPTAAQMAFIKSDVVLAPTDHMVASSITLLSSIAHQNKKPLIVCDNLLVKYGALASRGIDFKEGGKQTAHMAYQVLVHNKQPNELPIEQAKSDKIYINKNVADDLNITIPESLGVDIVYSNSFKEDNL